jgi:hypothetical protein
MNPSADRIPSQLEKRRAVTVRRSLIVPARCPAAASRSRNAARSSHVLRRNEIGSHRRAIELRRCWRSRHSRPTTRATARRCGRAPDTPRGTPPGHHVVDGQITLAHAQLNGDHPLIAPRQCSQVNCASSSASAETSRRSMGSTVCQDTAKSLNDRPFRAQSIDLVRPTSGASVTDRRRAVALSWPASGNRDVPLGHPSCHSTSDSRNESKRWQS